jgi:polyribonucleotide nucleotidyltransferase
VPKKSEEKVIEAMEFAHKAIQPAIALQEELVKK